jgi:hypothetical protein
MNRAEEIHPVSFGISLLPSFKSAGYKSAFLIAASFAFSL